MLYLTPNLSTTENNIASAALHSTILFLLLQQAGVAGSLRRRVHAQVPPACIDVLGGYAQS